MKRAIIIMIGMTLPSAAFAKTGFNFHDQCRRAYLGSGIDAQVQIGRAVDFFERCLGPNWKLEILKMDILGETNPALIKTINTLKTMVLLEGAPTQQTPPTEEVQAVGERG